MALFLLHQASLLLKTSLIIVFVFSALNLPLPHNKFLHRPLYEPNWFKKKYKIAVKLN